MYSNSWTRIPLKFFKIFPMVLKFHKLEYHGKLDFATLEYPKSGWFLHIFETVVDCNIIWKNVLFGYFRQIISVNKELTKRALLGFFSIERRERNMEDGCYLLCFSQSTYLSLSLCISDWTFFGFLSLPDYHSYSIIWENFHFKPYIFGW